MYGRNRGRPPEWNRNHVGGLRMWEVPCLQALRYYPPRRGWICSANAPVSPFFTWTPPYCVDGSMQHKQRAVDHLAWVVVSVGPNADTPSQTHPMHSTPLQAVCRSEKRGPGNICERLLETPCLMLTEFQHGRLRSMNREDPSEDTR